MGDTIKGNWSNESAFNLQLALQGKEKERKIGKRRKEEQKRGKKQKKD
jgi:hypothetical protein